MFEQSLYDNEPVAPPQQEGDLFHNYEIRSWDLGPRIYKILAIAGAANLLALIVTAQASLLTMKGCDSPLVSSVCQALDTVVVATTVFGTERDYIDAAYEKTDLGDVDVTFVDVSGEVPPLSYPEGYFQLANPEQFVAQVEQTGDPFAINNTFPSGVPITPPSSGGSLINTKPVAPRRNNDIIDGDLPGAIGETKPGKPGKGKPTVSPTPEDTTAKNDKPEVEPTRPVGDLDINKRPFVDLGNLVNGLLDAKQLNLDSDFRVMGSGKITNEGRLDPKSITVKIDAADPKMKDVLAEAIKAMDASGYLQYLQMFGASNVTFVIQQKDDQVTAQVESTFKDALRARTMTGLLTDFLKTKKDEKSKPDASANDKDDLVLLSNAKTVNDGNKLIMQFLIPKADLRGMLQRKLDEQKAEKKKTPETQNTNVTSGKINSNNTARN